MPGTRATARAVRKAASARPRERSMGCSARAMAEPREASMTSLDPRTTPARPDLAARHLEGQVAAARFVDGTVREIADAQAPLRRAPAPDAPLDTEALKGERVTVYESNEEGWSWGQLAGDGYVGWLPAAALAAPGPAPTHRVAALRTLAFPGPSIQLPPVAAFW